MDQIKATTNPQLLADYARRATGATILEESARSGISGGMGSSATDSSDPLDPILQNVQRVFDGVRNDNARPVDRAAAARLAMRVRRYGRPEASATSNADVMKAVTEQVVLDWYRAQGLSDEEIAGLRSAAWKSGLGAPASTFVNNTLNYIVAPALTYATGKQWVGAGFGLGFNFLQPWMVALQQSACKTFNDWIGASSGHTVESDEGVDHRFWLQTVAQDLAGAGEATHLAIDQFHRAFSDLMGIADPPQQMPCAWPEDVAPVPLDAMGGGNDAASLKQRLDHQSLWDEFAKLHDDFESRRTELFDQQRNLFMTQGVHEKHAQGHRRQFWPRMLRSPVATLVGLGEGPSEEQHAASELYAAATHESYRKATISSGASVGIQAVLSLTIFGGQCLAAACDEHARKEYINKLNLVYGNFFTEKGAEKDRAGEDLGAEDIDEEKLRSYISSSNQALTKLARSIVGSCRREAEDAREALLRSQTQQAGSTPSTLERGPGLAGEDAAKLDELEGMIADFKEQELAIEQLDASKLKPDSMAALLLEGLHKGQSWRLLGQAIVAKYKKKGETSVQTAQRLGQGLHLLVLGSFAAGSIGKVSNAIVGGAEYASTGQIAGVAAAGAAAGGVGAFYNSDALDTKDHRRALEEDTMGFWGQVGLGMLSAPIALRAAWTAFRANAKVQQALTRIADAESYLSLYKEALALKRAEEGAALQEEVGEDSGARKAVETDVTAGVDDQIANDAALAAELQSAFNAEIPLEQQLAYFQLMEFKAMKQIWDAKGDSKVANSFAEKIAKVETELGIAASKAQPKTLTELGEGEWLNDAHISTDQELLCNVLRKEHPSLAARVQFVAPAVSCLVAVGDEKVAKEAVDQAGMGKAELLIVPINDANGKQIAMGDAGSHWSLLVIDRADPREPRAIHYDSMSSRRQAARALQTARRLGFTGPVSQGKISQQADAHSCGDYAVAATREIVDRRLNGATEPGRSDLSSVKADRPAMMDRLKQLERPSGQQDPARARQLA